MVATKISTKSQSEYLLSRASLGADWLVNHQAPDGSISKEFGIGAMHKAVWALYNTGRIGAATRLLDFLKRNATEPGEFHLPGEGPNDELEYGYRNSFILVGALKMGRFDVASKAAVENYVKRYQHSNGGFFGGKTPSSGEGLLDPCNTCLGGWVCLYSGRYAEARKAGDFLIELIHQQPDLGNKLYFLYDTREQNIVTKFPADESISYVIDTKKTKQWFYNAGVECGFLVELGQAVEDSKYFDCAREYGEFCVRLNPQSLTWVQHCKSGWGVAQLYRVTKDPRYREYAERVAEHSLIANQLTDGHWERFLFPMKDNGSGYYLSSSEVTAEFIFELTEIVKGMESGGLTQGANY